MVIREARAEDAEAMSRVLIASIAELCGPDHGGDATVIERWTSNKTPEAMRGWLANPANHLFVAEEAGEILCVGAYSEDGEVQLNYVAPEARFKGVSRSMLARIEDEMRRSGLGRGKLTSTETAHRFYRSAGWADDGPPQQMFGVARVYPMTKTLA